MPLGTNNLEVQFQLCWLVSWRRDAPRCRASWPFLKEPGPGEVNRCPQWDFSVLGSTSVLRSTPCLGGEWGRRVLNIRATNPTPGSCRRDLIDACSLYEFSPQSIHKWQKRQPDGQAVFYGHSKQFFRIMIGITSAGAGRLIMYWRQHDKLAEGP